MLSVTGANFTPDNGSVVCSDCAVPMQTHLGAQAGCALGSLGSVLPKPPAGKGLCLCFSPVEDFLQLTNKAMAILGFSTRSVSPSAQECE